MNKLRPLLSTVAILPVFIFACNFNSKAQKLTADTVQEESGVKVHSPHKATIYSVMLPGLGQAYNKKYWKIPILYAGIGVAIYAIDWNTKRFKENKDAFRDFSIFYEWKYLPEEQQSQTPMPTANSYQELLNRDWESTDSRTDDWFKTQLQNRKDSYKHDRDLSYIILVGVYVLNIIDAAVDAHLMNFNVNDELSLRVEPAAGYSAFTGNSLGFRCKITF